MPEPQDVEIPIDYLQECLSYQPKSGKLFWRRRPPSHFPSESVARATNTRFAGQEAGSQHKEGYLHVGLRYQGRRCPVLGHRAAYALMKGEWPEDVIGHRDRDLMNNRWRNLEPWKRAS